ncbi:hypothetical protein [Aureliella helgolandensis]|uniref:Uncharacterized protein n=1 Tax=Aureliella helgolandensis TaxID=2527968 RepID=A0A518GC43_9BACT|nr:hypothetical protein [Aureliella helgolandensis]QDV26168.1 hypothetical protein Q31a_45400 [Aureliella helgolandensis]
MKNLMLVGALCLLGLALQNTAQAQRHGGWLSGHHQGSSGIGPAAHGNRWAKGFANQQAWHGQHYYLQYGQPTALVVPPNVTMQQNYSWGVSQNTSTPIYHQYGQRATSSSGGAFLATPPWPSSTRQFGVYPVRGPW